MSFEFDGMMCLLFCFFDFELLFNWDWVLGSWLFALFFLIFFFVFFFFLFDFLFLWDFSFLGPLFNESTIFESDHAVFCVLNFETDSESLMLRILCRCFVISDMFVEADNVGLILNEDFNGLFSLELDGFAGGDFGSEVINHFSLSFRILCGIQSEVVVVFNEVPIELNSIVDSFVQSVLWDLEERTFDGCL